MADELNGQENQTPETTPVTKNFFGKSDLTTLLTKIKTYLTANYVRKDFKTGSTTEYKVLSDNNLTDELVANINASSSDKLDKTGDAKDATVTFTAAETRENVATGDTFAVILGKIAKMYADLKAVAFSGSYTDLSDTPENVSDFTNDAGYLVDTDIEDKLDKTGDGKDVTVTFTEATERANVATGDTLATAMGKVAKTISDMADVAFTGDYGDLSNVPTKVSDFTNDSKFQTESEVAAAITTATTNMATTTYVDNKIDELVGEGTPETLDTLKEIADALAESDSDVAALTLVVAKKINADDITEIGETELNTIWNTVFTD